MTIQNAKRVTGDLLMTGKRASSWVYSVYICDRATLPITGPYVRT